MAKLLLESQQILNTTKKTTNETKQKGEEGSEEEEKIYSMYPLSGSALEAMKEGLAPPGRFIGPIDIQSAFTFLLSRAPYPLTSFC